MNSENLRGQDPRQGAQRRIPLLRESGGGRPIDLLSPLELLEKGLETERLETIPLGRVLTEDALVDDFHAEELGASMKQKRGQITPIAVRPRISEKDGGIVYDIIDGFHRTTGKKKSGDREINATVIYGASDEEMMDLRILAASSVKAVQFPRIAQWMTKSFQSTPWAERGLTVAQAFGIAVNESKQGRGDLSHTETAEVQKWVKDKCRAWGKSPSTTYATLRMVESADPDLVRQVRNKGGGKDRSGQITPALLAMVVDLFPGVENHPIQRSLLKAIVEKRLYVAEARHFISRATPLFSPEMDEHEIYELIKNVEIQPDELSGAWNFGEEDDNLTSSTSIKKRSMNKTVSTASAQRAQIKALQQELERISQAAGGESVDTWWREAEFLSDIERECAERIIYGNLSAETVAEALKISPNTVNTNILSALKKRSLFLPQKGYQVKKEASNGSKPELGKLQDVPIEEYMGFLAFMVRPYINTGTKLGMSRDDLMQVAALEFIRKYPNVDPEKGKVMTYMGKNIKGAIKREFRDRGYMVHAPRSITNILRKVTDAESELREKFGENVPNEAIADYLSVDPQLVGEARFANRVGIMTTSRFVDNESDLEDSTAVVTFNSIDRDNGEAKAYETILDRIGLRQAFTSLSPRVQRVVALRFGLNVEGREMTQTEIAEKEGLSQMHISRLLTSALKTMEDSLTENAEKFKD